jgi:hypothetical protein
MPWKETCAMNERMKFIVDHEQREVPLAVLCRQYGISRMVGHKWLKRYEVEGVEGLQDRSRAPKHHPRYALQLLPRGTGFGSRDPGRKSHSDLSQPEATATVK